MIMALRIILLILMCKLKQKDMKQCHNSGSEIFVRGWVTEVHIEFYQCRFLIAQWYGLDDRGFESRYWLGIFHLTSASRTALRPTQPPIQWVPGALSLGIKRLGREADHSPPSSAGGHECLELYLHSPIRLHGALLSLKNIGTTLPLALPNFCVNQFLYEDQAFVICEYEFVGAQGMQYAQIFTEA
jgi:hypothetical protein